MNITYRVIWNNAIKEFVVASENARGKTKSSCGGKKRLSAFALALSLSAGPVLAADGIIANSGENITVDGQTVNVTNKPGVMANDGVITGNNLNIITANGAGVVSTGSNASIDLSNSSVETAGINRYGAFIKAGAKLTSNNVEYTTNQRGSAGIYATDAGTEVTINGGTVNANGISNGLTTISGAKATVTDTTFNATSRGLYNQNATLVANNVRVNVDNGLGAFSSGVNADTVISDSVINTTGEKNYGLLVSAGGRANSLNTDYTTTGKSAAGIYVTDAGSQLSLRGGTINATQNSNGLTTISGAKATVTDTTFNATSRGLNNQDATLVANNVRVNADNGLGAVSSGVNAETVISDSVINTTGDKNYGLLVSAGSRANSLNTDYKTTGKSASGVFVTDASSHLSLSGGTINATQNSNGITAVNGAAVDVENIKIDSTAHGIYAGKSIINAKNVEINVNPQSPYRSGVAADGDTGVLNIENSKINVYGKDSFAASGVYGGVVNNKNMDVTLHGAANGFSARLWGKNNVEGATIKSTEGGQAITVETGSTLNASNVNALLDNNIADNENIGLASAAFAQARKNTLNLNHSSIVISGLNATGISTGINDNDSEFNLTDSSVAAVDGDAIRVRTPHNMVVNVSDTSLSGANLIKSGYKTDNSIIESITLNATNRSILTGNADIDRSQTLNSALNLSDASVWTGASSGLHTLKLSGDSQWNVTGNSNADSITLDNSTLSFAGQGFSNVTTGSLNSNNGSLLFKTALGDDNSRTDTLHIAGDYTGNTNVSVTNAGGIGAQTLNGISLIEVDGAVNGRFVQKGRIVAGAYDYNLVQAGKKWLLKSDTNNTVDPGTGNEFGGSAGGPGAAGSGGESPAPAIPVVRAEAASYVANLAAANTLFSNALSQRPAVSEYTDLSGERHKTSLWVRNIGGQTRFNDRSGQVNTRSNRYALQLGGDLGQWQFSDTDRLRVGTMVGYGNVQSKSHSRVTGYSSRAKLNGYSAGVYASWSQNEAQQSGAYVDSSVLYNWFNNSVTGEGVSAESYKSRGITASLESGYNANVAALNENYNIWLSPQAQLSVMDVRMHNLQEHNGTQVRGADKANVQTRLGTRAYLKAAKPDGMSTSISPYVEASWIHRSHDFNARLNGVRVEQAGARNVAEIKAGVDASLNKNVSLWGNISQQLGSDNYRDTSAVAGIKVSF